MEETVETSPLLFVENIVVSRRAWTRPLTSRRRADMGQLWMSLACDLPQEVSRGVDGSGGCVRGCDTNSRPSAWLWQLRRTTARSRTPPHGDRRPAPEPGRWRSKFRKSAYGHRRLLHRGRGRAPTRPLACPYWLGRRVRWSTPPPSPSSHGLSWRRRGRPRRRSRRQRGGRRRPRRKQRGWSFARCSPCLGLAARPSTRAGSTQSPSCLPRRQGGRGRRRGRSGCRSVPRDILLPPVFALGNLDIILRALRSGSLLFGVLVLLGSTVDTVLASVLTCVEFLPYFLRVGLGS